MESQKTLDSQVNPEQKEQCWRNSHTRVKAVSQIYRKENMVLAPKPTCSRSMNPKKTETWIHRIMSVSYLPKIWVFSTNDWKNLMPRCGRMKRYMSIKLHENQRSKCESWNAESARMIHRQYSVRQRCRNGLSEQDSFAEELRPAIHKWDLVRLKSFYSAKEIIS